MLAKELSLVQFINQKRVRSGLSELRAETSLTTAARGHSRDLAQAQISPGHTGSDGSTPAQRIRAVGYAWESVGENVAVGQPEAEQVVDGWEHSTTHRKIMMNPDFLEIGVGYHFAPNARYVHYWTATFGRRRTRS